MANYNREEAEKQGNAAVGVAGALLLGLAGVVGAVIKEVRDSAKKQDVYEDVIAQKDKEIEALKRKGKRWG